jgi:hypothetical protein
MIVVNIMYCPRCGKAEQEAESYCRQCGFYLPDLSKSSKRGAPPEEHLKANTVLSVMTIITCFTLAFLLFLIMGFRSFTHPLVYVTAGLLIAMGGWHIQTLIRTLMLKTQWKRRVPLTEIPTPSIEVQPEFKSVPTGKLLDQANFENAVPASVTENTTRHLVEGTRSK